MRLLSDPSFRAGAKQLGDLVAAEAESSTIVQELEAVASEPIVHRCSEGFETRRKS
jgi:hypothetical protein